MKKEMSASLPAFLRGHKIDKIYMLYNKEFKRLKPILNLKRKPSLAFYTQLPTMGKHSITDDGIFQTITVNPKATLQVLKYVIRHELIHTSGLYRHDKKFYDLLLRVNGGISANRLCCITARGKIICKPGTEEYARARRWLAKHKKLIRSCMLENKK